MTRRTHARTIDTASPIKRVRIAAEEQERLQIEAQRGVPSLQEKASQINQWMQRIDPLQTQSPLRSVQLSQHAALEETPTQRPRTQRPRRSQRQARSQRSQRSQRSPQPDPLSVLDFRTESPPDEEPRVDPIDDTHNATQAYPVDVTPILAVQAHQVPDAHNAATQAYSTDATPHAAAQVYPTDVTPHTANEAYPVNDIHNEITQAYPIDATSNSAAQAYPGSDTHNATSHSYPIDVTPHAAAQAYPITDTRKPESLPIQKRKASDTTSVVPAADVTPPRRSRRTATPVVIEPEPESLLQTSPPPPPTSDNVAGANQADQADHQDVSQNPSDLLPSDLLPGDLRRPKEQNKWWSISEYKWNNAKRDAQIVWNHVGRIMEIQGVHATPACKRCQDKEFDCLKYTEEAKTTLSGGAAKIGDNCARCRMDKKSCNLSHGQGAAMPRRSPAELAATYKEQNRHLKLRLAEKERAIKELRKRNIDLVQRLAQYEDIDDLGDMAEQESVDDG